MLLIFPPVAKPGEPPAGIAMLAGALQSHGITCELLDANIEGLLYLLGQTHNASDTWTKRAAKNVQANIAALRDAKTYRSFSRYSRTVRDVNRVLGVSGRKYSALVSLADYQDRSLSPVRSADLICSAEHPEQNPFYPYFSGRLPEIIERTFSARRREGRKGHQELTGSNGKDAPQTIGLSVNYLSQALTAFAMIGFIRKEFPGMKIVLGGGLVSSWMARPGFQNTFIGLVDQMIAGPGEGPLLDLFGVGRESKRHALPDYASLPVPDYLSPGFILPYSASSGCYWNKCSFCPETAEENPYVPVPVSRALADLKALASKRSPVMIHLLDNAVSPALMHALADNSPGVPWYGFARIDGDLCDPDFCMALKRSGCGMLKLGLESGDQGVLDRLCKGIDLETAANALKNLSKAGIATYVYLLFGTPVETVVEARRTLDFVIRHRSAISFLNLAIFNMPVCGADASEYGTGQFYEGDLSLYTGFGHPWGWDRKEVRLFLEHEFKKHPAVSAIMKNDPPLFTSNHAVFFNRSSG